MTWRDRHRPLPDVERFATDLVTQRLWKLPTPTQRRKIEALIRARDYLHSKTRAMLVGALRAIARRWNELADRMEAARPDIPMLSINNSGEHHEQRP
jgi:hypothetical protein